MPFRWVGGWGGEGRRGLGSFIRNNNNNNNNHHHHSNIKISIFLNYSNCIHVMALSFGSPPLFFTLHSSLFFPRISRPLSTSSSILLRHEVHDLEKKLKRQPRSEEVTQKLHKSRPPASRTTEEHSFSHPMRVPSRVAPSDLSSSTLTTNPPVYNQRSFNSPPPYPSNTVGSPVPVSSHQKYERRVLEGGWQPKRKLTRAEMDRLRAFRAEDQKKYDVEVLAQMFLIR